MTIVAAIHRMLEAARVFEKAMDELEHIGVTPEQTRAAMWVGARNLERHEDGTLEDMIHQVKSDLIDGKMKGVL